MAPSLKKKDFKLARESVMVPIKEKVEAKPKSMVSFKRPNKLKELLRSTIMFGVNNTAKLGEFEEKNYKIED